MSFLDLLYIHESIWFPYLLIIYSKIDKDYLSVQKVKDLLDESDNTFDDRFRS